MLRSTKGHRGALFAEVEGAMQVVSLAANLVEVKATRVDLKRPTVSADGQTIVAVWQLEETANTAELGSTERALSPLTPAAPESFEFADRDRVIGHGAAEHLGYPSGGTQWTRLLEAREAAHRLGGSITLMVINDGPVTGEDFLAHITYGWTCYGVRLTGITWQQL